MADPIHENVMWAAQAVKQYFLIPVGVVMVVGPVALGLLTLRRSARPKSTRRRR